MHRRPTTPLLALLATLLLLGQGCAFLRTPPPHYETVRKESGLILRDLAIPVEGDTVQSGDEVTIEFTLSLEDGTLVESSVEDGRPITFEVGEGSVPRGLDEGVLGMRRFGRRLLVVPPRLAYGDAGAPPKIPPATTLRFEVEVMEIHRGLD